MPDRLDRLRQAVRGGVVPFVGSGASVAATDRSPHASWAGLLEDGIASCQRLVPDLPSAWAEQTRTRLDGADVITYLTVADEIVFRLRELSDGREYEQWLAGTVGALKATPRGNRLLQAIGKLSNLVVTTNYDRLLEEALGWPTVTWTDHRAFKAAAKRGAEPAVVHLHGVVSDTDSVILGGADYERLLGNELQKFVKEHLFGFSTFVFVGCGDGLRDRSIAPVLRLLDSLLPPGDTEHFNLVLGAELRAAMRDPLAQSVSPVAYGAEFDDLASFLESLADPDATLNVNQDPSFYEGERAVHPRTALLDLAGPAEEALQQALETLRRALRAASQLERRTALPAGWKRWELAEQHTLHQQVAASAAGPGERLAWTTALLEQTVHSVEHDLGQLLAKHFVEQRDRLEHLLNTLAELDALCSDLRCRCAESAADLGRRLNDTSAYRTVSASVDEAREHAEEAATVVSGLTEDFGASAPSGERA